MQSQQNTLSVEAVTGLLFIRKMWPSLDTHGRPVQCDLTAPIRRIDLFSVDEVKTAFDQWMADVLDRFPFWVVLNEGRVGYLRKMDMM